MRPLRKAPRSGPLEGEIPVRRASGRGLLRPVPVRAGAEGMAAIGFGGGVRSPEPRLSILGGVPRGPAVNSVPAHGVPPFLKGERVAPWFTRSHFFRMVG
jgi:hypothetical protein